MEAEYGTKFPLSDDAHEQDVWLMANRTALLYYHLASAIADRLGQEKGEKPVKDAVWAYGEACRSELAIHLSPFVCPIPGKSTYICPLEAVLSSKQGFHASGH